MALRIGDLTNATSCVGTDELELSLAGSSGSRRMSASNLRKQLFAGGTGFTSTDPITAGAASFTTGSFAGNVLPTVDNTYSLGSASFRWSDFRSVLGTFTSVTGTLLTAAQPNVTSLGTLTSLTVTPGTTAVQALTATTFGPTGLITSTSAQVLQGSGQTTGRQYIDFTNTGARFQLGIDSSAGGAMFTGSAVYSTSFGTVGATSLHLATNNTVRFTIDSAGAATFTQTVTTNSRIFVQEYTAYQLSGVTKAFVGANSTAGSIITGSAQYDLCASVVSGQSISFSNDGGATIGMRLVATTGVLALSAGLTVAGAVSGITTLAGTGAISGFTSLALSSTITGATNVTSNKLTGGGSTPGNTPGTGAGTTPTIVITGTDTAGLLSITTGTGPSGSANLITVTFATAYAAKPYVVLFPADPNALGAASKIRLADASGSASQFVIFVDGPALGASTNHRWYYLVIA